MIWYLAAFLLSAVAIVVGEALLRLTRIERFSGGAPGVIGRIGRIGVAGALGFSAVGTGIWALGMTGLLDKRLIVGLTVAAGAAALIVIWRAKASGETNTEEDAGAWRWLLGLAAAGAILLLWIAGVPELEIDDVTYHQTVQRAYLNAGGYFFTPFEPHSAIHQLNNTTALWAFCFVPDSVITPKLLETIRCILAACAAIGFAARFYSPRAAMVVGALVLFNVSFLRYGVLSHVDAGISLYFTASAWMLAEWLRTGGLRTLALGAWLAGCLVAAKQTGAFMAGPLLLSFALAGWVLHRNHRGKAIAVGVAFAVAPVVPWLIKNAVLFGSPFYPFFDSLIPPSEEAQTALTFLRRYYPPVEMTLAQFLPDWGRVHPIVSNTRFNNVNGFVPLAAIAALLLVVRREAMNPDKAARIAILAAFAPIAFAFLHTSFWRFFIPVYPVALAMAVGECDALFMRSTRRRWLIPAFHLLAISWFVISGLQLALHGNFGDKKLARWPHVPALTKEDVRRYHERRRPDADVVTWLNENLETNDGWLLFSAVIPTAPLLEPRFYPNVPCIAMEAITTMDYLGWTAEEMEAELRRLDVRYIVTRESLNEGEHARLKQRALREMKRWEFEMQPQPVVLYELSPADSTDADASSRTNRVTAQLPGSVPRT